jgi:hypothetical protein
VYGVLTPKVATDARPASADVFAAMRDETMEEAVDGARMLAFLAITCHFPPSRSAWGRSVRLNHQMERKN